MDTLNFATVPMWIGTLDAAVDLVLESRPPLAVKFRLVNSGTLNAASKLPEYHRILADSGVNFPDGAPLARMLRVLRPDCQQIAGPALFEACLKAGQRQSTRHYLLGTTKQTLASLTSVIRSKYPDAEIVGSDAPSYRDWTPEELVERDNAIRASEPDIVWVALGTPRQDLEAARITDTVGVSTVAVGAAFDFTAGVRSRAPYWMRKLYLEWLFRLAIEPRRLWRRYLFGNAQFLVDAARFLVAARNCGVKARASSQN